MTGRREIDADTAAAIVRAAVLAPSSHNTQPWYLEADGSTIELFADVTRRLPVNDPDDRELLISCGTALLNIRARAAALGFVTDVELPVDVPEHDGVQLVARVGLRSTRAEHVHVDLPLAALARAIPERHTCRVAFAAEAVDDALVDRLTEAAAAEGAELRVVDDDVVRGAVADLVDEGDRRQFGDRRWRRELARWLRPRRAGDGLSLPVVAVPAARAVVGHVDLGRRVGREDAHLTREAPVLAVLATAGDGRLDRIAAGQALERVLLTAADAGVQAGFSNQPCQVAELRPRLAERVGVRHPQLVLRLGFPPWPPMPTPRRPPDALLHHPDPPPPNTAN